MRIYAGIQLGVDAGYKSLIPDERYYYLGSYHPSVAHLVFFYRQNEYHRVGTISVARSEFESIVSDDVGILRPYADQLVRPFWLWRIEGINLDEIENTRKPKPNLTYSQRVNRKLESLHDALEKREEIFSSKDPRLALSSFAKAAGVHPYRFESQFFSYVLHGDDRWSLMTCWHESGRWDREEKGKKFGRAPLIKRYDYNHPLTRAMRRRCVKYARASKGKFRTFVALWDGLLRKEFGVKTIGKGTSQRRFHPESEPFPSSGQAYRAITEALSDDEWRELFGKEKRHADTKPYNEGNVTEQFASNLEGLEVDAYSVEEVPTSFISEKAATRLYVARAIDPTGSVVGVGFSVLGEGKQAYRCMLFVMVADRAYVEKLFGLEPGELSRWNAMGIGGLHLSDRGPAGWKLLAEGLSTLFPFKSIAPSRRPRARAAGEASHPRTPDTSGDPHYFQSGATLAGLMKRELIRAVHDNETSSILDRLSDKAIEDFRREERPATPFHYWEYNAARGREKGTSKMDLKEAVRNFWEPIDVVLTKDGIEHIGAQFTSDDLVRTPTFRRVGQRQRIVLRGYSLDCAVRFLFVEVDGDLVEVERVHRLRMTDDEYSQTAAELEAVQESRPFVDSQTRHDASIARVEYNQASVDQMGEPLDGGTRRKGPKPSGNKVSNDETAAIRSHTRASAR